MAIVNRDKDASEQKCVLHGFQSGNLVAAQTMHMAIMPWPCTIESLKVSAVGVSNAPAWSFEKLTGTGASGIAMGLTSMTIQARGTSGAQGFSLLAAAGSTLLNFAAGDVLSIVQAGASVSVNGFAFEVVVKKTQDILSWN